MPMFDHYGGFIGACVLEAIMSIFMIVAMSVIKRNDLRDFQGKRITVAKPRISDDVLGRF